jgi:tryptophan 2,3-dioxygenase
MHNPKPDPQRAAGAAPQLSYGRYLQLEKLLDAQKPLSGDALGADTTSHSEDAEASVKKPPAHDEMLFIIVHQSHELWFKQMLFELDTVLSICSRSPIAESDIGLATFRLERITSILGLLGQHLSVLETMTPMDFLEFRHHLSPASGFQSVQFRMIEAKLGLPKKHLENLKKGIFGEVISQREGAALDEAMAQPSLLDLVGRWLERTPFLQTKEFEFWSAYRSAIETHLSMDKQMILDYESITPDERKKRIQDTEQTRQAFMDLFDEQKHQDLVTEGRRRLSLRALHAALFIYLYRDQPILQGPFRFLTQLTRIDELIQSWRAGHAQMVHRMIGVKVGTGGSSGYEYLRNTVQTHSVFSDLCALSTFLLPRSALPELPKDFIRKLGFWSDGV